MRLTLVFSVFVCCVSSLFGSAVEAASGQQTGDEQLEELVNTLKNPNNKDFERTAAAVALMNHGPAGWQRLQGLLTEAIALETLPSSFSGALKAIGSAIETLTNENDKTAIEFLQPLLDLRRRADAPREVSVLLRQLGTRESLAGELRKRAVNYLASSEPNERIRGLQASESLWNVSLAQELARIAFDAEALDPSYRLEARKSLRNLVGRTFESRREFDDWYAVHGFSPREEILESALRVEFESNRKRVLSWIGLLRVEDLLELLGDREDPLVRRGAAAELVQRVAATATREPAFVLRVVTVLAERSRQEIAGDVRLQIVQALAAWASAKIKDNEPARTLVRNALLERSLVNGTAERTEATVAIGGLEAFPTDPEVRNRLLEMVISLAEGMGQHPKTEAAARDHRRRILQVAKVIEFAPDAQRDRLLSALESLARRDEAEAVRGAAIDALAKHGGTGVFTQISEFLVQDASVLVRNKALTAVDALAEDPETRRRLLDVWIRALQNESEPQIRQSICERLHARMGQDEFQPLISPLVYETIGKGLAAETERVELRRWMWMILTEYLDEQGLHLAFRHLTPAELSEAVRRIKGEIDERPEKDRPGLLVRVGRAMAPYGPVVALREFIEPALAVEANGGGLHEDAMSAAVIARWNLGARMESFEVFPPPPSDERVQTCRRTVPFLKELPANLKEGDLALAEIDVLIVAGDDATARERLNLTALAKPDAVTTFQDYGVRLERAAWLEYVRSRGGASATPNFDGVRPWVDKRMALFLANQPKGDRLIPCYAFRRIAFEVNQARAAADQPTDEFERALRFLLEGKLEKGTRAEPVDETFVKRALEVARLLQEPQRAVLANYLGALELPATLPDALKAEVASLRGS